MALDTSTRYTDARRTRVYQGKNRDSKEEFIGQTQAIAPKEKLFDGLSVAQVIAGAAAAATSVALASHIGIAGSVLGAAISSVITVVSSQVYRRFLTAGVRRLKGPATAADGTTTEYVSDYGYSRRAAQGYYDKAPARYGARVAPTKLQARAAAERAATQRKVVLFSVAAGVLAVALCAGAVLLSTQGMGLGQRIDTLWPAAEAPVRILSDDVDAGADTQQNDASAQTQTDSTDTSSSSSTSQDTDATDGSTSQDASADTSGSAADTSQGDGSSTGGDASQGTDGTSSASSDGADSGTSTTDTTGNAGTSTN